ncbi:MAG TPA: AzlC family ABC transporter permease [Caldimonas sp.]|nr:AzlC family ABC transporter permease [Caldimonas sp.]HEX2539897.1 AzlC family ABC transporter permease [Caldimonas sp.]
MSLRALLHEPHFRRGARDMMSFAPGLAAWGLVTGVAMTQSGLGVGLAILMSLTVYAGSAQLASLPLLASGAPMWVIWASAACVNLRFVLFSAQWRTYLGHLPRGRRLALGYLLADLNLVMFQKAWPSGRREPGQARYAAGGAVAVWLVWQSTSLLGILASSQVPMSWGLGFAGTLSMLGIAYALLVDRTAWLAAFVAATAAIAAFALPLKLNILVAIAAAVAAGLLLEQASRAGRALGRTP